MRRRCRTQGGGAIVLFPFSVLERLNILGLETLNRRRVIFDLILCYKYLHCPSVHQAAKLVAALLRVAGVTAGQAESDGSLPSGL